MSADDMLLGETDGVDDKPPFPFSWVVEKWVDDHVAPLEPWQREFLHAVFADDGKSPAP